MLKAGFTAFTISIRNQPVAIIDMLKRSGGADLIVSSDATMTDNADEVVSALAHDGVHIKRHPMPVYEDLFGEARNPQSPFDAPQDFPEKHVMTAPAVILHSSGE